jgi:hypothetical protein
MPTWHTQDDSGPTTAIRCHGSILASDSLRAIAMIGWQLLDAPEVMLQLIGNY